MRLRAIMLAAALPVMAHADVTVSKPWMRFLLPNIPAAGYMVLQNNGNNNEILTGAASPACSSLMLHESKDESGMAMMMDVPSVVIPAHGTVTFAPGGYHLMCMNPHMKVGDNVPVTLTLKSNVTLSFSAKVYGAVTAP
ncbi:copper chaperone PCu(A)C [Acidocella sp.]|uniref:copper chaperone PCu(A)C n=1 Tax=Acidocella sp. TaxID=50710 RepID=UPI00260FFE9B|nr:copper chaperone PCu(A)C [Acidocella sp.]MDD2795661.1 copper chaperone PCu(A)C [Acidocella sp.]